MRVRVRVRLTQHLSDGVSLREMVFATDRCSHRLVVAIAWTIRSALVPRGHHALEVGTHDVCGVCGEGWQALGGSSECTGWQGQW